MSSDCYTQQRLDGADQILKEAEKMALAAGIKIEKAAWDNGRPIIEMTNHELAITAQGEKIIGQFPDEWLADYPGRAGTEKAKGILSEMIRKLGK